MPNGKYILFVTFIFSANLFGSSQFFRPIHYTLQVMEINTNDDKVEAEVKKRKVNNEYSLFETITKVVDLNIAKNNDAFVDYLKQAIFANENIKKGFLFLRSDQTFYFTRLPFEVSVTTQALAKNP